MMDWYEEYERDREFEAKDNWKLMIAAAPVVTVFVFAVYVFNVVKAALF